MWFSFSKREAALATGAAAQASEERNREAAALARLRAAKAALDGIESEARLLKQQFRLAVNKFGTILHCECGLLERGQVEKQWRSLLKRRDAAGANWHEALREWASVKGAQDAKRFSE